MSDRRRAYLDRAMAARRAGGRCLSDAEHAGLVAEATKVAAQLAAARSARFTDQPTPHSNESWVRMMPGHVAVHADVVLGMEVERNQALATLEQVESHRMELLALVSKAQVLPAAGDPDLFKLEDALLTGKGLPRNPEAVMLEVVRELIRWRAAAGPGRPAVRHAELTSPVPATNDFAILANVAGLSMIPPPWVPEVGQNFEGRLSGHPPDRWYRMCWRGWSRTDPSRALAEPLEPGPRPFDTIVEMRKETNRP